MRGGNKLARVWQRCGKTQKCGKQRVLLLVELHAALIVVKVMNLNFTKTKKVEEQTHVAKRATKQNRSDGGTQNHALKKQRLA